MNERTERVIMLTVLVAGGVTAHALGQDVAGAFVLGLASPLVRDIVSMWKGEKRP